MFDFHNILYILLLYHITYILSIFVNSYNLLTFIKFKNYLYNIYVNINIGYICVLVIKRKKNEKLEMDK